MKPIVELQFINSPTDSDPTGEARWLAYHESLFVRRALASVGHLDERAHIIVGLCLGVEAYQAATSCLWDMDRNENKKKSLDLFETIQMTLLKLKNNPDLSIQPLKDNFIEALDKKMDWDRDAALSSVMEGKFQTLARLFELEEVELTLTKLTYALTVNNYLSDYLEKSLDTFSKAQLPVLSALLAVRRDKVTRAYQGHIYDYRLMWVYDWYERPRFKNNFFLLIEEPIGQDYLEFCVQSPPPVLTEEDFFLDAPTWALLKNFLRVPSKTANHILFYGPPGVGKTKLARVLAAKLPGLSYEVKPGDDKFEYRQNLVVAHKVLRNSQDHILIVDEADQLLEAYPKEGLAWLIDRDGDSEKAWLDQFMEKTGPNCLWIVNDASELEASVIRRFAFSVKFEKPGAKARTKIWRNKLKEIGAIPLSESSLRRLAQDFDVSPAVIAQSLEKTRQMGFSSELEVNQWLNNRLMAHLALSGQRPASLKLPPQYRATALSTNPPLAEFWPILEKWRARAVNLTAEDRQGLSLLFYGPPGAGKTEMAHYLAQELDLEVYQLRFPDIISPNVGQSEINLAKFFDRNERALRLVLVDEVESFLYHRDIAVRTWELSLITEFLACWDNFKGLLIGTTNRPEDLDPTGRGRFIREIGFGFLDLNGRLELFKAFLTPLTERDLSDKETQSLGSLPPLVPADFVRVAEAKSFSNAPFDNLDLIAALANQANRHLESTLKSGGGSGPDLRQRLVN
ncbi:MAG: AAA family ATPase [Deltaproteobacteria bacterium]|jgi:SpoVK/Ycf46/Vps4 family AAA+-type ATPase|nr:AAA family ATPase [Deltaproteobacteria bacterium]